jgi:hypothetical protein
MFPACLIITLICLGSCSEDKARPPPNKGKASEAVSATADMKKKGDSEMMAAKMWIHENWNLLDDKTKEKLEPFYVRAHHPKNHFNKTESELKDLLDFLSLVPDAGAAETPAFLTVAVNGKEKAYVYYRPAQEERAKWVAQAILDA